MKYTKILAILAVTATIASAGSSFALPPEKGTPPKPGQTPPIIVIPVKPDNSIKLQIKSLPAGPGKKGVYIKKGVAGWENFLDVSAGSVDDPWGYCRYASYGC